MMQHLNLSAPTHLTEALRVNMSGAKSVSQLLVEAARCVPFISLDELNEQVQRRSTISSCSMCERKMLSRRSRSDSEELAARPVGAARER